MVLVLWKASVKSNEDLCGECAEGFGALRMLCAEIANWVRDWSKKTFLQKILCSTAAHGWHRVWGPKRNVPQIYTANLHRNFIAIFSGLGDRIPPPPRLNREHTWAQGTPDQQRRKNKRRWLEQTLCVLIYHASEFREPYNLVVSCGRQWKPQSMCIEPPRRRY